MMTLVEKWSRDRVFLAVLFFLLAAFSIVGKTERPDCLAARSLTTSILEDGFVVGQRHPPVIAYGATGARESVFGERPTTLIFKEDCTCDTETVTAWQEAAIRRGENLVVFALVRPEQLNKLKGPLRPLGRFLSIRRSELNSLGLHDDRLPYAFHISKSGMLLSTENRN